MQGNSKDIPTASAACIDAETLAAWADGGLSKADAAAVEVHLADCDRCTAMVAAFARTIPAAPATESLWKRWHLRWLVPVATAATVVSLYVLIPRQQPAQIATFGSAPTTEAKTEPAAPPPAEPPAAAAPAPAQPATGRVAKEQDTSAFRQNAQRAREQSADEKRADATAPAAQLGALNETIAISPPAARDAVREEKKLADAEPERFSPPLAATAPSVPASPPAPAAGPTAPATAASSPAVDAQTAARSLSRPSSTLSGTTVFEVVSPDSTTRWRVSGVGQVERSTNGGARWERATLPESATLTGGSSPAPTVCWLAGRSGAIYVTTNGLRFTRVSFPERTDFVSIQAIDARRATVVTIDGRTMRTEDQGATWIRIAP